MGSAPTRDANDFIFDLDAFNNHVQVAITLSPDTFKRLADCGERSYSSINDIIVNLIENADLEE